MAVNMATLTPHERELFISIAPEVLQDPYVLMDEVVKGRLEKVDFDIPRTIEEACDQDFHVLFESELWQGDPWREEQQIG